MSRASFCDRIRSHAFRCNCSASRFVVFLVGASILAVVANFSLEFREKLGIQLQAYRSLIRVQAAAPAPAVEAPVPATQAPAPAAEVPTQGPAAVAAPAPPPAPPSAPPPAPPPVPPPAPLIAKVPSTYTCRFSGVCFPNGSTPCCGASGWCGKSRAHCRCDGCKDYRPPAEAAAYWSKVDAYEQSRPQFDSKDAKCLVEAIAKWPRPWLMLVGDSNWRHLFLLLTQKISEGVGGPVKTASVEVRVRGFDARWFDQDFVYDVKGKQVRLSLRFMSNPNTRLLTWSALGNASKPWYARIQQCGTDRGNYTCYEQAQPSVFENTAWKGGPHAVVLTHGLWNLPSAPHACETRKETGRFLLDLGFSGPASENASSKRHDLRHDAPQYFLWASNFHIVGHPRIRQKDIDLDRTCQQQVAQQYGFPIFDTDDFVKFLWEDVSEFHLRDGALGAAAKDLARRFGLACAR